MATELVPAYLPDDGIVSQAMIRHLRNTENQDTYKPYRSLFPGV